jgi:hypothetical protein
MREQGVRLTAAAGPRLGWRRPRPSCSYARLTIPAAPPRPALLPTYRHTAQVVGVVIPDDSGVVNTYGRILGGVRVSQTRSAAINCSRFGDVITSVVGPFTHCYPDSTASSSPYGDPALFTSDVTAEGLFATCHVTTDAGGSTPEDVVIGPLPDGTVVDGSVDSETLCWDNVPNVTGVLAPPVNFTQTYVVATINVTAAFTPSSPSALLQPYPYLMSSVLGSTVPADQQLPQVNDPFAWTFDYYSAVNLETVGVLQGAGWVDIATKTVHTTFGILNPDIGYWGRALVTTTFTRGGRVLNEATVRSLPVEPYTINPALAGLDFVLAVYVAIYCVEALRHTARRCRRARKKLAEGDGYASAAGALLDPWYLLDVGTGVLLLATIGEWIRATATLAALRAAIAGLHWTPATVANDTFIALAWIEAGVRDFTSFKVVGVLSLAAFMMRLFWQFSLQPKLSVMTETLSRACSDVWHFSILFAVILIFYGVWGQIFFGPQLDRWRSNWQATWAIVSFTAYDYDLQVRPAARWRCGAVAGKQAGAGSFAARTHALTRLVSPDACPPVVRRAAHAIRGQRGGQGVLWYLHVPGDQPAAVDVPGDPVRVLQVRVGRGRHDCGTQGREWALDREPPFI